MSQNEAIVLRARDGSLAEGAASVTRWSGAQRGARAGVIAVSGFLVGAVTIPIPMVHFIAPWLAWLVTLGLTLYVAQMSSRIDRVEGRCAKCGAEIRAGPFGNSSAEEPLWVRCPSCTIPLEVRWPT
jgi:DNA-directed RNA polymerase subunit RPC12/RpoP